MKHLYFLLFLISQASVSFCQGPELTLGESNATTDYIPVEVLGQVNDKYIMLCWVPALSLSSVLSGTYASIKDLKIAVLDAQTMKKEKLITFPEFKGQDVERTGKMVVEHSILNGDTLNLFTSAWDKDAKEYIIHVWQLNALTLKPYTAEAKLISRMEDNGKSDFKRAAVKYLKFTNQMALISQNYQKNTKETTISVHRFDRNLNELGKDAFVIGNSKHGTGIQDIDVDQNGNLYFINAVSTKQFPDWDDDRWIRVTRVPAAGGEQSSFDITLSGGDPINGKLIVAKTGELYVTGFYSKMIDPKDGGKEFFGGSYIVQIDPNDGQIIKTDELELTGNQKVSLWPRALNPNAPERTRLREMNAMKIADSFVDERGNITIVGYASYNITTRSSRGSTTTYYANSLIVSNFNKDASVVWQTTIPRVAFVSNMPYGVDPLIVNSNGNINIVFNDDNDNIEPLSMLAQGKTLKSSSKEFKPKDYPPTNTDTPVKLEAWSVKGTAVRHTIVDSEGMWKINWLNPAMDKKEAKIPMIDGTILREIGSNEFLSSCFTNYSMFGLTKSALVKIKF
jgi:hypothetical protein